MFVSYAPEDAERQEWEFDPTRIRASVAEKIEKTYGEPFDVWVAGVQAGNMRARRVLLWYLFTLQHPAARFDDLPDFYSGELKVQFGVSELVAARERLEKANLSNDMRERSLAAVDIELTEAMAREAASDAGKAPSPDSADDGGSTSPSA